MVPPVEMRAMRLAMVRWGGSDSFRSIRPQAGSPLRDDPHAHDLGLGLQALLFGAGLIGHGDLRAAGDGARPLDRDRDADLALVDVHRARGRSALVRLAL